VNKVNGIEADHHVYVVPDIVAGDVVNNQARKNLDQKSETTYVHHHKHGQTCEGHEHKWYGPEVTPPCGCSAT
jgi:hypothetical protein